MKTIHEPARDITVIDQVDVLVVGGGVSGFAAAVWAARQGAKTMLTEQSSNIGGISTNGLMSHWVGDIKGGFFEEILMRTNQVNGNIPASFQRICIEHETLKMHMLEMLEEAGVNILLYTFAASALMENDRVIGVVVESKSGRQAILAKLIIDCTGDGDIAASAGAEYFKGRESDGLMQPATVMFQVSGVDLEQIRYIGIFEDSYGVPNGDVQTLGRIELPSPAGHVLIFPAAYPNTVSLNMTNMTAIDGTTAEGLTKADIGCRKQMPVILRFLQENIPGFEHAYISKSASIVGIRETRHFKGLKTITEQDIAQARIFDDWAVCNLHFNFDVHNMTGSGLDITGTQKEFKQLKRYTIPYGCFIPEKIQGLMLAGRNISGTHLAHSNFRVMPACLNMGQSVGIAAAMCIALNVRPCDLPVEKLQMELASLGINPDPDSLAKPFSIY